MEEVLPLTMSNCTFRGYRTISQHLNDLKKENFSLKLRIYFLEEKIQQKFEESSDDVHKRVSEWRSEWWSEWWGEWWGEWRLESWTVECVFIPSLFLQYSPSSQ